MPDQPGFNAWHADIARSPACDLIIRRALALPENVVSNSLLPWWAIPEIAVTLQLAPGDVLVDLACGRGSYGRELARRAGAVVCVDSIQFSDPPLAALRECQRVLVDGGRLAITAWEAIDPGDERLPDRTRRMNLARDLTEAGFTEVEVTSKPDWHEAEHALWEAAARAEPNGDPGLDALQEEATRCLATHGSKRRVLATATVGE